MNAKSTLRKLPPFANIVLALVVMVGWKIESVVLTKIYSSFPAMQFNTAFCFLLAGLALVFIELKNKLSSRILAVLLGLLSGTTLLQYLSGLNFGVDLLFHQNPFSDDAAHFGRMAVPTAVVFTFSAFTIFASSIISNSRVLHLFKVSSAFVIFCVGLISMLRFIAGIDLIGVSTQYISVAIHTGFGFCLLGAAIFLNAQAQAQAQAQYLIILTSLVFILLSPFVVQSPQEAVLIIILFILTVLTWRSLHIVSAEAKNLSQELSQTLSLLESTGHMAKVGGWELDLETGNVLMSEQAKILHDIDENFEPLNYSTGAEWYPPDAWPAVQKAIQKALKDGIPYDIESPFITAKKRNIWVRVQGAPFYKDNKISGLRGTFQDISEKRLLQEQVEAERIKSVHNAKLASLGEMAAGIAHEINNPLAVIVGSVPLVSKFRNDDAKFNSKLETIAKSAERIEKIVKGLKKFSRTADGSMRKPEAIASIVSETLIFCEAKSKRYSTPIETHIDPELRITCDGVEIEQVLVNLINNGIDAVKSSDERWIKINAFADGAQAVVQVIDSGQGITSDIETKLFQPFFTTKVVGEGTGLGLSISKGILDDHKASFALNRSFKNTCFEIRFAKADQSEVKNAS